MRGQRLWAVLFLLSLTGCGASLVDGQAGVDSLCNQSANIQVPGNLLPFTSAFTASFDYPIDEQLTSAVGTHVTPSDLRLDSLTIHILPGLVSNFSFVKSVSVAVDGADPASPLMTFTQTPATAQATTLDLSSSAPQNLVPALQEGQLKTVVTVDGMLPAIGWTFTAKSCVSAHVNFNY
jgi:hypothetical protein